MFAGAGALERELREDYEAPEWAPGLSNARSATRTSFSSICGAELARILSLYASFGLLHLHPHAIYVSFGSASSLETKFSETRHNVSAGTGMVMEWKRRALLSK